MAIKPLNVFVSYSHKDEKLREVFDEHIGVLKQNHLVKVWHDEAIIAGAAWKQEIFDQLEKAEIVILLLSPAFLSSSFCHKEMLRAIEKHKEGSSALVPVLLRECAWQRTALEDLQCLPRGMKPIADHRKKMPSLPK